MGEVLTVLPFQNTVATFQLTGADLLAALENGVSKIDEEAGRFLQVSGMKYSFDRSKPVGSRVSAVEVKEGEGFVPLDPAKTYGVVTNNYVRGGGDGFKILSTNAKNAYDFGPNLEQAVASYLGDHNPTRPIRMAAYRPDAGRLRAAGQAGIRCPAGHHDGPGDPGPAAPRCLGTCRHPGPGKPSARNPHARSSGTRRQHPHPRRPGTGCGEPGHTCCADGANASQPRAGRPRACGTGNPCAGSPCTDDP